jgi:hypothetical protein
MPDLIGTDMPNQLNDDDLDSKNIVIMTASSNQKVLDEISKSGVKGILESLIHWIS